MKKDGYQMWLSGWSLAIALTEANHIGFTFWFNLIVGILWLVTYNSEKVNEKVAPLIGATLWKMWRPIAWRVYGAIRDYRFGRWVYTKDTAELLKYQRWAQKALPYEPDYKEEKVHE